MCAPTSLTNFFFSITLWLVIGTIKKGNFGEVSPEEQKITGKETYDVQMIFWCGLMKVNAILNEDKKSFTMIEIMVGSKVDQMYLLSPEEIEELKISGQVLPNILWSP